MDVGILKKSRQLKESYSGARVRLNRMLIFEFSKRLQLNMCYRCNKKIDNIEEFSIDHKTPWLDSNDPIGLFFDLNNVTFSHLRCNSSCSRGADVRRKPIINGTYWCYGCKTYHPKDWFSITKEERHRHRDYLKGCCNKYRKDTGWGHRSSRSRSRRGT